MDDTPNLGLPYIMAAQSQKHVTHNEAIRALDAVVQLAVLDRHLSAPPVSPAEGALYIVGGSPTGAWSGHAGKIAAYQDGAWMLYAPVEGWIAWIGDEDVAVVWDGIAWTALTTGGGSDPDAEFDTVAINGATADATNRLSLNAPATLLNHDGNGHQLKINKAAAGDTASLLYQTAFSGRAEMGLAGDDDFHFKVSANGSAWKEAILINRSTGGVTFPFTSLTGGREVLAANRTYFVGGAGASDSNDGLTSGAPFATGQHAINVTAALDISIYNVTLKFTDATRTQALVLKAPLGSGRVIFEGNTTTPGNCIISTTSADCFSADSVRGTFEIKGFKMTASGAVSLINVQGGGFKLFLNNNEYASAGLFHVWSRNNAIVEFGGTNQTISGGAPAHMIAQDNGIIVNNDACTFTVSGTPAFAAAFVIASGLANIKIAGITYSGSATGKRYDSALNALINTQGGGASKFPGDVAGTATTGLYA